ncbi:MAG TPA: helix-turn-helix domain-containing protein [Nitrospirota bacterium]|nr:helix-turn-helix domain-containing protein [Nitrospirota bacterium]
MILSSGNKFRCYPTEDQKRVLSQWMGCQRLIYNAKVEEDRYFRTVSRKALAFVGLRPPVDQQYAQFKSKELTPYLYEVPSQILRNGATRFMQAYSCTSEAWPFGLHLRRSADITHLWAWNRLR